jgi:hypothetical protein
MNSRSISGLKLSQDFFHEIVKPILSEYIQESSYDAALIGPGSEVVGFDDLVSTDHHWGPRFLIFLSENVYSKHAVKLKEILTNRLPYSFKGYSTNWSAPDLKDNGVMQLIQINDGNINHRVKFFQLNEYILNTFGTKSLLNLSDIDWLMWPEQRILEFTSGKIFHDGTGQLKDAREKLSYFPENVWRFKILAEWQKISQLIAFVGRTGSRGAYLGSKLITSRLIRYIMRLAFLLEKKYIPYEKWFGFAFKELNVAPELEPLLIKCIEEKNWRKREEILCESYLLILDLQNCLNLTPKLELSPTPFFSRDILIIDVKKIVEELKKTIKHPLSKLKYPMGSIDQFMENANHLDINTLNKVRKLYD